MVVAAVGSWKLTKTNLLDMSFVYRYLVMLCYGFLFGQNKSEDPKRHSPLS